MVGGEGRSVPDGGFVRAPRRAAGREHHHTTYHVVRGRHDGDRASGRDTGTPAGHRGDHRGKHYSGTGRAERNPGRDLTTRLRTAPADATP
ncbi:hypothetical protein SHO565_51140 [Streptomyces sp. HO565]